MEENKTIKKVINYHYEVIDTEELQELIKQNNELILRNDAIISKIDNLTNYTILIFVVLSIYCGFFLGRSLSKND